MKILGTPRQVVFLLLAICAAFCAVIDIVWGYFALSLLCFTQILLLSVSRGGSFLLVHYATLSIYFSVAPMFQLLEGVTFWEYGLIADAFALQAFSVLLVFMLGVELGWVKSPGVGSFGSLGDVRRSGWSAPLLILSGSLLLVLLFMNPDLTLTPRGVLKEREARPLELILLSTIPKMALLLCFAIQMVNAWLRKSFGNIAAVAILLLMCAIGAGPVTTARQILLIALLPIALCVFAGRPLLIVSILWLGIAGLGPVANFISRNTFHGLGVVQFPYSADFDAMYVAAGFLQVSGNLDFGWGAYSLNAWSFFLPKELKPFESFDPLLSSPMMHAFSQSNLSFPAFMTAYLDFGYVGVVLMGFVIARMFGKVEKLISRSPWCSPRMLVGLVAISSYIPFLRGPILGWGPFALSGIFAALILGLLLTRKKSRRIFDRNTSLAG